MREPGGAPEGAHCEFESDNCRCFADLSRRPPHGRDGKVHLGRTTEIINLDHRNPVRDVDRALGGEHGALGEDIAATPWGHVHRHRPQCCRLHPLAHGVL